MIPLQAAFAAAPHGPKMGGKVMGLCRVVAPYVMGRPQRRALDGAQHRHRNRQPRVMLGTKHKRLPTRGLYTLKHRGEHLGCQLQVRRQRRGSTVLRAW
jgi:hypothetical protein